MTYLEELKDIRCKLIAQRKEARRYPKQYRPDAAKTLTKAIAYVERCIAENEQADKR